MSRAKVNSGMTATKYAISMCIAVLIINLLGCGSTGDPTNVFLRSGSGGSLTFSETDRKIIHYHYNSYDASSVGLPQKQRRQSPKPKKNEIVKNEKLPEFLGERPLPATLERRLSELPPGYVRRKIGADIVIMNKITRKVTDVIYDV